MLHKSEKYIARLATVLNTQIKHAKLAQDEENRYGIDHDGAIIELYLKEVEVERLTPLKRI